jgi:hypothetical protein
MQLEIFEQGKGTDEVDDLREPWEGGMSHVEGFKGMRQSMEPNEVDPASVQSLSDPTIYPHL